MIVLIGLNRAHRDTRWIEHARDAYRPPKGAARLLAEGQVTLRMRDAMILDAWARTLPGWSDAGAHNPPVFYRCV